MARVVVSDGSSTRTIELVDAVSVVGRSSENRIAIDDKQCSRKHCHFEKTDFGYKLVDLESRNGTRVNDRVVNQALLRPGDRVQIGKHVITFEDPAFKEPPADVAARFAPPPAAAPPPAPPAPAKAPEEKPAAAAPPPPPPPPMPLASASAAETAPGDAPSSLRRRTGHTTIIERTARYEREKEKKLITGVAVAAVAFVLLLVVLLFLPSSGETPAVAAARKTIEDARGLLRAGKLDEAQNLLGRVPPEIADQHRQAQAVLADVDAARKKRAAAESGDQGREFEELSEFCEKNRANPRAFETVLQRCEAFKIKYPRHSQIAKVDEWLAMAAAGRKSARRDDLAEFEKQSQIAVGKDDYAAAIRALNAGLDKIKDDFESRAKLNKHRDEVIDQAKVYTAKKRAEATDLAGKGKKDEAVRMLEALVIELGDGNLEELADFALLARTTLQGLK